MALSGTLSTKYSGYTYKIDWSAAQDIANNKSTITCKHYLVCASTYDLYIGTRDNSCTVDGASKSFTSPAISTGGGSTISLGTTTHTVTHNADGTKSCTVSGVFNIKATLAGTYKASISVSGTISLNQIARASQPSCITWPEHTQNVGEFGDTISIHTNRKSDKFTHTIRYAFGSKSGTIATGVGTGTTWKIPLDFMDLLPNDTKGSGTIYLDTYNGSTKIGTKSCGFTATVPASVKPTCSVQVLDATDTKDTFGSLVKGLSKLSIKTTGKTAYSSPIKTYTVKVSYTDADGRVSNFKYSGANVTTDLLPVAGSVMISTSVTDGRGRTSTAATAGFVIVDYEKPTVSVLLVHRCDASGNEDENGEYVSATFSVNATDLDGKNTATWKLKYKKASAEDYQTFKSGSFTEIYSTMEVIPADSDSAYSIQIVVSDTIETTSVARNVSTAFTLYNCHSSGKGWAFGKVAEEENTLENNLELRQIKNRYAYQPSAFSGEKGYTLLATISLNTLNVNAPIVFVINRRGALCPMNVYVRFASSSSTTDPDLGSITYEGDNYGAFLVKVATSKWSLYVDNTSGWSNPCLQDWFTTDNQNARLTVKFPSEQVEELPTPYYRATPAKMQSILDYVYPVGSVYISYSHVDPATLFGGTWTRIQNAFLWGCDASGTIGQTGGEKTHTLTASEMPSHSHKPTQTTIGGMNYFFQTIKDLSSVSTARWGVAKGTDYLVNGASQSASDYEVDTVNAVTQTATAGSGAAHNNMPPYIQVSIWRRTA